MSKAVATLCGKRHSCDEVMAVPEVERTLTWNPIHHGELIQSVERGLDAWGYDIMSAEYSLDKSGMRLFFLYVLGYGNDGERTFCLGGHNSMDRSFAVKLAAAIQIFICSNLSFHTSSDGYVAMRKHTSNLSIEELRHIAHQAVGIARGQFEDFANWMDALHDFSLSMSDARALADKAMDVGVLPPGKYPQWRQIYMKGEGKSGNLEPSLYGFYQSITETWSDRSLLSIGNENRNKQLQALMDESVIDITDYSFIE